MSKILCVLSLVFVLASCATKNTSVAPSVESSEDQVLREEEISEDQVFEEIAEKPEVIKLEKCQKKIKFAWNKNEGEDIVGYKIHYGPSLDEMTSSKDVGNKTEYKVKEKLEKGKWYYFAVSAYNKEKKESPPSDIIAAQICETKALKKTKL